MSLYSYTSLCYYLCVLKVCISLLKLFITFYIQGIEGI